MPFSLQGQRVGGVIGFRHQRLRWVLRERHTCWWITSVGHATNLTKEPPLERRLTLSFLEPLCPRAVPKSYYEVQLGLPAFLVPNSEQCDFCLPLLFCPPFQMLPKAYSCFGFLTILWSSTLYHAAHLLTNSPHIANLKKNFLKFSSLVSYSSLGRCRFYSLPA